MTKVRNIIVLLLLAVPSFAQVQVAAERTAEYFPLLKEKKVAVVGNQTSVLIGYKTSVDSFGFVVPQKFATHLVDTLLAAGVDVQKIFSPEHGFRGTADAGAHVNNGIDAKTGLPVVSLYGSHKKPTAEDLQGINVVVFDIQDVGARFYTYISTMHYVMEACAENNVPMVVLDRPNPNGFYVDGPVLKPEHKSFVGMHPVPIVHGMTIGEYAQMINGEKWLANGVRCDLQVIPCEGYDHTVKYTLPVAPSPNLPNMQAIYLYPTLCLFEGTVMSCGRGTDFPFQAIGSPCGSYDLFSFTPTSKPGASKPLYEGELCHGEDFRQYNTDTLRQLDISIWQRALANHTCRQLFFNNFFTKLAGTKDLQQMLLEKTPADSIRNSWRDDLEKFKNVRKKYLLYADFE